MDPEVLVIGAGVAGLAALSHLQGAGVETVCLEARDRVGGRILTVHDPLSSLPVELGAEFIHGRPPEIWNIIRETGMPVYDGADASVHLNSGEVEQRADSWDLVGHILKEMQSVASGHPDISFDQFLNGGTYPESAKRSARGYVEGFNAAKSDIISIQALSEETKAAELIDGDRVYRFFKGYDSVPLHLLHSVPEFRKHLLLNRVVESVLWKEGEVTVHARSSLTGNPGTFRARRLIVTVPLGVLQAGSIRFQPEPTQITEAAKRLCFGQVFRVVFRFKEPFWESNHQFSDAGFLLSQQDVFPTWWTTLAVRSTNITGWSAGAKADPLLGRTSEAVISEALESLATITGFSDDMVREKLEHAYFHDWHADPFARGAYSYVPVGAIDARKAIAAPVGNTLFFAGEATDQGGHSATVHGAMATGYRAAKQILGL